MKKKIALLATVAMAGALFAGPALARDNDDYNYGGWRGGNEWREHHTYQGYGNQNWGYRNGYPYSGQRYANQPEGVRAWISLLQVQRLFSPRMEFRAGLASRP
jgi:hypothetical protein